MIDLNQHRWECLFDQIYGFFSKFVDSINFKLVSWYYNNGDSVNSVCNRYMTVYRLVTLRITFEIISQLLIITQCEIGFLAMRDIVLIRSQIRLHRLLSRWSYSCIIACTHAGAVPHHSISIDVCPAGYKTSLPMVLHAGCTFFLNA